MAEIVPAISVTNHFGLGATFGLTRAETREVQLFAARFDANGNYLCSSTYDTGDEYSNEGDYCGGGSPDIVTALGTFLTTLGDVESSGVVTMIEATFEAGLPAHLRVDGHQHDTTPHVDGTLQTADVSGIIPASSGLGVPTLITVTGSVSPVRAGVTFEVEHVDKVGADGAHFSAQNLRFHVRLSVDYEGQPSGVTAGNWLNIILAKDNENTDTPTANLTAEQWIDAT